MKTMIKENQDRCFVSRERGTIIDLIANGLTIIYGKTLTQVQSEYPDAEETTVSEFCSWKAKCQRRPIAWLVTTEDRFDEMLCCLPPAAMQGSGFLVGEPWDHDALTGEPRFQAFRQSGDLYEVSSRPMTKREFLAECPMQETA